MRKFPFILILVVLIASLACTNDEQSTWDKYTDWRNANNEWLVQMQGKKNADGTPYYQTVVPDWNPGSFVLIHYFNDRAETEGNLSPLYSSTVDTRYFLHLYDGTPIDSSVLCTTPAPGVYRTRLTNVVQGWAIALSEMRCGDTAEVIVPYGVGYGSSEFGTLMPYSNLRFNIRLVDIPFYEQTPYGK